MHVKKLIVNDPDTVKVTSKQTAFVPQDLGKGHSVTFE